MSKFSGSCPPCNRLTLPVERSTSAMPSFDRSGGGNFDSSTPGPPIGDPLTATTSVFPSGVRRTPRGRWPASIVCTTLSCATSTTVTLFPRSSDTYTNAEGGLTGCAAGGAAAVDSAPAAGFFSPPEHAATIMAPATMLLPNDRPCHVPRISSLLVQKYRTLRCARPPDRLCEPHPPPGQRRRIPAVLQQLGVKPRERTFPRTTPRHAGIIPQPLDLPPPNDKTRHERRSTRHPHHLGARRRVVEAEFVPQSPLGADRCERLGVNRHIDDRAKHPP